MNMPPPPIIDLLRSLILALIPNTAIILKHRNDHEVVKIETAMREVCSGFTKALQAQIEISSLYKSAEVWAIKFSTNSFNRNDVLATGVLYE